MREITVSSRCLSYSVFVDRQCNSSCCYEQQLERIQMGDSIAF